MIPRSRLANGIGAEIHCNVNILTIMVNREVVNHVSACSVTKGAIALSRKGRNSLSQHSVVAAKVRRMGSRFDEDNPTTFLVHQQRLGVLDRVSTAGGSELVKESAMVAFRRVSTGGDAWSNAALPASLAGDAFAGIDAYVEAAKEKWSVPAVAMAVVKDGQVVLVRGYGMRRGWRRAARGRPDRFSPGFDLEDVHGGDRGAAGR